MPVASGPKPKPHIQFPGPHPKVGLGFKPSFVLKQRWILHLVYIPEDPGVTREGKCGAWRTGLSVHTCACLAPTFWGHAGAMLTHLVIH